MNLYVEGSEFNKKFREKHDGKPINEIMKKFQEAKAIDDQTVAFLEMFRENYFGEDQTKPEILMAELTRQHRTHQQSIIKNLFTALKMYADFCTEHRWYDDRNKAAVEWAKKATEGDFYFPCI